MPTKAGSANNRKQLIVTVQIATHRRGIPHARTLAACAQSAFTAAAMSKRVYQPLALTIRVVGSAESRRLNRMWRGKDKPTNVLSFPASSGQKGAPTPEESELGDLALCAPVIRREAREQGKTMHAHWAHMIVHGVLHLLGYDHEGERDAERMEGLEIRILARMGIDNPYLDALAA